jgi:translation initiation factor IF-3
MKEKSHQHENINRSITMLLAVLFGQQNTIPGEKQLGHVEVMHYQEHLDLVVVKPIESPSKALIKQDH